MTETPPTAAAATGRVASTHAVVEWVGADGQKQYLLQRDQDHSRQITFDVHFDASTSTGLLKLRAPLVLKALPKNKTPLFLYIPADRITSLVHDVPGVVPDAVTAKVGAAPRRLQLCLARPVDMVVPRVSLAPQNKVYGDTIDSLKLLAQETRFSVYLKQNSVSEATLETLSAAVATRVFKPVERTTDLRGLYGGQGGKILEGVELCLSLGAASLPSYDELAPTLPPPPLKLAGQTGQTRKRRRGSASSADDRSESVAIDACKKMVEDMMSRSRQEDRAYLDSRLQELKMSFSEDLQQLKTEILEHVDKRLCDVEDRIPTENDIDHQISQHVASFDDLVDVKIEDRVTGIRMELEDFVEEEIAGAEERVLQRVREANWTISLEE